MVIVPAIISSCQKNQGTFKRQSTPKILDNLWVEMVDSFVVLGMGLIDDRSRMCGVTY
jgi:hypothetical protein